MEVGGCKVFVPKGALLQEVNITLTSCYGRLPNLVRLSPSVSQQCFKLMKSSAHNTFCCLLHPTKAESKPSGFTRNTITRVIL